LCRRSPRRIIDVVADPVCTRRCDVKKLAFFGLIAAVVVGVFLVQRRRTAMPAEEREVGHLPADELVATAS
jgi:hypothetical protein